MSDESEPAPLRLRPKLRAEGDPPPAPTEPPKSPPAASGEAAGSALRLKPRAPTPAVPPASPAPAEASGAAEPPPSSGGEPPRVRLRPRLTPEPVPEQVPENIPSPEPEPAALIDEESVAKEAVAPVVPPSPAPAVPVAPPLVPPVIPAVPAAPAEPPRFKLKPKTEEGRTALPVAVPVATADEPPPLPPPAPVAAEPQPPPASPSAPPVAAGPASSGAPGKRRAVIALVSLLVVGGIAYLGYSLMSPDAAPPAVLSETPSAASQPTAPVTPPAATTTPGQLVERARDAAAANAASVDALVDETAGGLEPREGAVEAAAPSPATGPDAAPPARISEPEPLPAPPPSDAFREFATEMRINGVFQGTPARALINGRTVRVGDILDHGLGVVFEGVDVERRLILMRDESGAQISRKY